MNKMAVLRGKDMARRDYNEYEWAIIKFANYLIEHSCFYDIDNYHSFRAIDIEDLDDLVNDFLRGK